MLQKQDFDLVPRYQELLSLLERDNEALKKYRVRDLAQTTSRKEQLCAEIEEITHALKAGAVGVDKEEIMQLQQRLNILLKEHYNYLDAANKVHDGIIKIILHDIEKTMVDHQSYRKDGCIVPVKENLPAFNFSENV